MGIITGWTMMETAEERIHRLNLMASMVGLSEVLTQIAQESGTKTALMVKDELKAYREGNWKEADWSNAYDTD